MIMILTTMMATPVQLGMMLMPMTKMVSANVIHTVSVYHCNRLSQCNEHHDFVFHPERVQHVQGLRRSPQQKFRNTKTIVSYIILFHIIFTHSMMVCG